MKIALRAAVSIVAALTAGGMRAQSIATADLQIQGVGLRVIDVAVTTGLDIPASVQTEFGGKQNDEAPIVEGLVAVGELDGPGIEIPIRLETAPGHKFALPALSREGIYFLRNIRLMSGTEFLQSAAPSVATITVSNLLQTAVRVRQLTPEELRARGITLDARNYEVFEYTFSFFIEGQLVEIPYPVVVDKRTREVRELPRDTQFTLPYIPNVTPPRWTPPAIAGFELGPGADLPGEEEAPPAPGGGGGRPSIPAALVIPNNLAVLHQFFAVTLMVTNGAPEGSSVVLDSVTGKIRTPAGLRVVKSIPAAAFNQPVPVVDATNGVTFLVAQAKGEVDWTVEGLEPGTHTLEVEVRATYKSPGQADFPLKGSVRASIVVHDPRFNITFSHPDTVRKGIDYSTFSFITNMSPIAQTIRVGNVLPTCEQSPLANVCRVGDTPEFHELTIPPGEMRMIEYDLRPSVTGSVFATAGSVSDDNITASVQLHMGVSESGIPLSPATLVMPHYAKYVNQDLVEANLQLLGLGYSLATAPLTQALAAHPKVIKTDVFQRAVDIARAGQRTFLGEPSHDALSHMTLDLLGNALELREWDELRRREKSGRSAGASIVRELEKGTENATSIDDLVDRFAAKTAHRPGYVLALLHGPVVPGVERPYALSAKGLVTGRRMDGPNEAAAGWVRDLPFGDLSRFTTVDGSRTGEIAIVGRWTEALELDIDPNVTGPMSLELIYPNTEDGSLMRAFVPLDGPADRVLRVTLNRGSPPDVRDGIGGIAAIPVVSTITPEALTILGTRQDLHLDSEAHKVSILFNRPATIAEGDDWLAKFHGQIILDKDGVNYTGSRPISAAALQTDGRIVNLTFDHALSQNAAYSIAVDPVLDPLNGTAVTFPQPLTPVIDNDRPGGIIFGHVLKGDNTPIADAEVQLLSDGAPQYDISRASDGSFLFEFVARDIDNGITGAYLMHAITTDDKKTSVEGAVRLPGRVHFVNLVFLGRGSAEGYVRYDNGDVVSGAKVVIGSTMFGQFRTATTDTTGFYRIEDLPVGPLTFAATDEDGNVTFGASELKTPGQVLVKDLSIFRRPFPGTGTIRGIVKRSDTQAAVAGAHVGVFSQGYGLIDGFTDAAGRFEFTKVPSGFVTVLAAEWTVSRESVALDFDLASDETRDVTMVLNVAPSVPLVTIEGDVVREDPLFPGDPSKYQKVAGALVKIENGQVVTADADGHFKIESVPQTASGKTIRGYDPITTRSASTTLPALDPTRINIVPIFISTASGQGEGTVRVRVLNAVGLPATGMRVLEPGFPPTLFTEGAQGVYTLSNVPVGRTVSVYAISMGGTYGDQYAIGSVKVEFNGHVAALTLRLGGQGTVRVRLRSDIDIIGDVTITYPVWDEAEQGIGSKSEMQNTAKNGVADYAVFEKVPANRDYSVASVHPVYGYAGQNGKLGYDGDLQNITLQLNKLSTVRGVVYAIDGRTPIPGAAVRMIDGRQDQGIFTSLPDGSFVFFNEPAGTSFRVTAEVTQAGVYRTGDASGRTPSLGGPVENISVIMRTQGGVDGRVVYSGYKVFDPQNPANNVPDDTPGDLSDNAPVPLARFTLREFDYPSRSFGSTEEPLSADVLGRFSFNNIFTGPLRVTAFDPGNQEMRGTWTGTLTQEGERITAIVGIGGTGFGSATINVVDPNNQNAPVFNAEVSLFFGGLFDFATTDQAGNIVFEQLPVGSYSAAAFSKALGRSGASGAFTVTANGNAEVRIVLEFSGQVTGKLSDPEDGGRGVPGAHVTLNAFNYSTRATTDTLGDFLFEGVREGFFRLTAKDTLSNRRASASRTLSQADPAPYVPLELEPTETLHLFVYHPNDTGGNSNVLVNVVDLDVTQRCLPCDFIRSAQGNSFQMEGLLESSPYSVHVKEVGGQGREIRTSASFPKGSAADPLKLVFPAYGTVEVHVTQANAPAANARVSVSGGGRSATVFTDSNGIAIANGIGLGSVSVQAVTVDGAFSGSATTTLSSQSTPAVVNITLGAFAGVTGYVEAELGGPSVNTRVVATFPGRVLEMFTDSNGRYTFQGIPTSSTVSLVFVGPDDITVGARATVVIQASDASKLVPAPNVKLDATPPQLVNFTPADGAQNVSPDTTLRLVFSEPIRADQINKSHIQLIPADSSTPVNGTYTSFNDVDGTFVVQMTPPPPAPGKQFPLESNTLYRIIVSGEIRDLTGNKIPSTRGSTFITTDYAQPSVVKVVPATTTPLQPATTFQFTFNEPIDPAPWEQGGGGQFHLYKLNAPGATGTIVRDVPGRAFVDPATSLTLLFAPDESIEPQSFYRVVFDGVRDMQGNAAGEQTFHFFSFDEIRPFVILVSPVPANLPLISGVEYTLSADIRDADANGAPATDIARVDYFRMDGETPTFIFGATKAPFSYKFVAPDVPEEGSTLTLAAEATDLSTNVSEKATISWQVMPNGPPQNVSVTLTPATSIHAGNRVNALVTFDDEGILATVQVELTATQSDGTAYTKSLVKQATRASVGTPWPAMSFDFDLPPTLQESSTATFTAAVTDVRGQRTTAAASLTILEDLAKPALLALLPLPETRYQIGNTYQIEALVQDLESGVSKVVFNVDGQTITVLAGGAGVTPGPQTRSWKFVSGQITVPAKNVDTRIPITVTAHDYHGNTVAHTVEVVYAGVNDPTIPKGAWLCPIDRAALPANQSALSVNLQVRATDDIAVTAVKFEIPGIATPVPATRVGTTDVYQATTSFATPSEGTPLTITAIVSDANTEHDISLPIAIQLVNVDIFVDDRVQAITPTDAPSYEGKSIAVRGTTARLVPHVPLTLKNLLVLGGGKVETLSTTTTVERRLDLTIADNLYIDCASSIDVSGRGYLGGWALNPDGSNTRNQDLRGRTIGNTPVGGPTTYAAASHAGAGGEYSGGITNAVYGSLFDPIDLGTGGAGGPTCCSAGASGGGAAKLQGGVFAISGAIRANGGEKVDLGTAGAGGSINLDARQFITGPAARITANGGDDDPYINNTRGAGGGRIAVRATERFEVETLGVQLAARGGRNDTANEAPAHVDGGAGTIFVRRPGQSSGELFVGALDERFPASTHLTRPTPLSAGSGPLTFDRVELGPRALVRADDSITIGETVDDRDAVIAHSTAVIVFPNDRPIITADTTPAASSSIVQGGSLSATYSATSIAGIGTVKLVWTPVTPDRVDSYFSYPASASPSPITFTVPTSTATGDATLTVTVTDRSGRTTANAPIPFTIVANAPPAITRFDVVPPALYPGKSVTATVSATDDLKVTRLTLTSTINNGTPAVQTRTPNAAVVNDQVFTVAVPITTPGGAPMTLVAGAEDAFPGRTATTQTFDVTILTDTIAPSLNVTSPASDTLFQEGTGALIQVRATATDAEVGVQQVFAQIDGGTIYPMTAGTGGTYSADIPVPPVDGTEIVTKNVVVTAKDYEGNAAVAPPVAIRIQPLNDPNAPVISWTCSTPGAMYPAGYAAKFRVLAIGNNVGNPTNGIQKVELFVDGSTTPIPATAVAGLANQYEATSTMPEVGDGTLVSVRAVATNAAGLSSDVTTQVMVVVGTTITANTTIGASDTTYDGQTIVIQGGTTTIIGQHAFTRLIVLGGAKVNHPATDATNIHRLTFTADAIYVACDGSIDASGLGFAGATSGRGRTWPNTTTGGSHNGAGGSHGGRGGAHDSHGDSAEAYGSLYDPNEPGGAGGFYSNGTCASCNPGGGIARIDATTFVLDGKVLANGLVTNSGGGAGGSIRIDAGALSGAGEIRADGGPTAHSAGGGGRIAIYYGNLSLDRTKITAGGGLHSGNATRTGAAGTVYFRQLDGSGAKLVDELIVDNSDRVSLKDTTLPSLGGGTVTAIDGSVLTLSNAVPEWIEGSWIEFDGVANEIVARTATTVTVSGSIDFATGAEYRGVWRFDQITARRQETLDADALRVPLVTTTSTGLVRSNVLRGDDVTLRGRLESNERVTASNLALQNGAVLTHSPTTSTTVQRLTIDVAGTLTVDATSSIDVTGRGLAGASGGTGRTWPNTTTGGSHNGAGGSHGGRGGAHDSHGDSAQTYGSLFDPSTPGGAGGYYSNNTCASCNAGGGVARITATTIVLDGKVLTNGVVTNSGGGAGGSIRIDAASLSGAGEIHADGGPTAHAAGGGGRIAIYTQSLELDKTRITAAGGLHSGNSTRTGSAGTIYFRRVDSGGVKVDDELVLDNLDRVAAHLTPLSALGTGTVTAVDGSIVTLSEPVPEWIEGTWIDFFDATGAPLSQYPIVARTATTVTVDDASPNVAVGNTYRGVLRVDLVTVRGAATVSSEGLDTPLLTTAPNAYLHFNHVESDALTLRGWLKVTGTVDVTTLTLDAGAKLEVDGVIQSDDLTLANGSVITQIPTTSTNIARVSIEAVNLSVDATSSIDVSGRGFTGATSGRGRTWPNTTTGGSHNGAGGSHGGRGGAHDTHGESAPAYGSLYDPNEPGGAGGYYSNNTCASCNAGGGIARIEAKAFALNGKVLANGVVTNSGGGAGGSIRIDAETLTGTGEIRADGGPTAHAAGGGGRIAVYYQSLTLDPTKITAAGGLHSGNATRTGAAGTVYLRQQNALGAQIAEELVIDNFDRAAVKETALHDLGAGTITAVNGAVLTLSNPVPEWIEGSWIDLGGALYQIVARTADSVALDAAPGVTAGSEYRGAWLFEQISARRQGELFTDVLHTPLITTTSTGLVRANVLQGDDVMLLGRAEVSERVAANNLTLQNAAFLTHPPTTATTVHRLTVDVAQTLTVDATSTIDVSGRGYAGASGGRGRTWPNTTTGGSHNGAGGSHGGRGGAHDSHGDSGATYGSLFDPNLPGAAGGFYSNGTCASCNAGGGIVRIAASSIALDGKILANGVTTNSGGGAGGSIRIDASTLSGNGEIRADGGPTAHAAGGGGRIAIYYDNLTLDRAKIVAAGGLHSGNATRTGAAGTIYLQSSAQLFGDLIVDNIGRTTNKNTALTSVGFLTATAVGPSSVTDANAQFAAPDLLAGIRLVLNNDTTNTWPIIGNDATTVSVELTSPLTAQIGDSFRGLYRFDNVTLRNARLEVLDLFESVNAVDKDAPSVILGSNLAPVLVPSKITLQSAATGSAILGEAGAVVDPDTPIALTATNLASANTYTVNANVDGSFTLPVQGNAGDAITLKARDANFFPLESPVLNVGTLAEGTPAPTHIDKTTWTTDAAFFARRLALDERHLLVHGGSTDKLAILSVTDPARPQFVRTVDVNNGVILGVAISNGWAVIASNDLAVLDLNSTTSTPIYVPDASNVEGAITISGGYAFTATPHFGDGRIRIYDVSNPGTPRFVRDQGFGLALTWDSLLSYGDYLIAITNAKPNGVGHDVVVINKTNIHAMVKVADLDVASFDAAYGWISGTRLYLTSSTSRDLVVVDLSTPSAPAVLGRVTMPANAGRPDVIANTAFVADTTAGLVEVDASNPEAPAVVGALITSGAAYDVKIGAPYAYVASDNGLSIFTIATPPQIVTSRISVSAQDVTAVVTGSTRAILGTPPITATVRNTTGNTSATGGVAPDGSFSITVDALAGDELTIEATDDAQRSSGIVQLGRVPFGSGVAFTPITPAMSEANYRARTLATDGTHLIVGGWGDTGSTRLIIFDVTDPAVPVYKRTVALSNGAINNVAIRNGWAIVAANDIVLLDLTNPTSTPVYVPDASNTETELLIHDGYAFTSTPHFGDARIRIYDASTPPAVRFIRDQSMGIGSVTFTGLAAMGSRYLLAFTDDRPNSVGHDVVVIDRSNPYSLVKIADLDIPGFNAYRGKVLGTTLYLAGTSGGLAVVDLSTPSSPVVRTILPLADARGVDVAGSSVFVANGSAGVTFLEAADPNAPAIFGTQPVGGSAWSVAFNRGNVYVANQQGLAVIQNVATAPIVDPARVTITPASGTLATVAGAALSIHGAAPLTVAVKNATTGSMISGQSVDTNGSFSVLIPAMVNESITVEATDVAGRTSGPVDVGRVPFGNAVDTYAINSALTAQNYVARTLATDGRWLVVGGYADTGTTKLIVYDVADPASPQLQRVVTLNNGAINQVAIHDGWAVVAANDLVLLDLNNPASTPDYVPDASNTEVELLVSGGYAFTATPHFGDARIRIYDVSRPDSARWIRDQSMGIGSLTFTGLAELGTNYLVAMSDDRPNGVGHDLVIIDRSNIHGLVKKFDLDIPNFNAFRGRVVGSTLYIAGRGGGLAIVDVSDPTSPSVVKVMGTGGSPNGVAGSGALLAVADGASGVTFVDIASPPAASVIGTQRVGGNAYSLVFNRGNIYVVNEQGLVVIRDVGTAPIVTASLVAITSDGAGTATVTGAPRAIFGSGSLTFEARNSRTGITAQGDVAADGSFVVAIAGQPGDELTIEGIDAANRTSGRTPVGIVPFGDVSSITITAAMSQTGYRPRTVATDGTHLVIGGYGDTSTTRLVVFDVSNPAAPQFVRAVNLNNGAINSVAIHDGFAVVAANDLVLLDLSSATSTPIYVPDPGNTEIDVAVSGGYAFSTTPHFNDARVRVHDVSNPAAPRYIREQAMGIGSLTFNGITPLGDDYLIATSNDRPNGIGHDVVVLDRRNVYSLAKVADLDIPAFDGFRGKVVGTTLYLGGIGGGLAVVDLSDPKTPVLKMILQTAGDAFGGDASGSVFAVADGSAGVTFLDVTDPFVPQIIGTQPAGGMVWSTAFGNGALYAVNEQGLVVVNNVAAPVIKRSLIALATPSATDVSIEGAAGAITGVAPFTANVRNARTEAHVIAAVGGDGSFSASLAAVPNDPLELIVTDGGGRASTLSLGRSPFGTTESQLAGPAQANNDGNYRARRIASDGANTIVTSGSTAGVSVSTSGRAVVFRPGLTKNYGAGGGINDVAVSGGYAFFAANDFSSLDLANENAAAVFAADGGNIDLSVAILGTSAFTSTAHFNDSRIRLYNITNPAAPVFVKDATMGIGSLSFDKVLAYGSAYLVAISADRPNGIGHDVVVINATTPTSLAKLADIDIPNFNAIDGAIDGTTLYLAGGDAGVAIVDLFPAIPVVTAIIDTPGIARGIAVSGTNEIAVADGSSGVTFIDTTDRASPVILGTHALNATNTVDVDVVGRKVYVASDNHAHTITRP